MKKIAAIIASPMFSIAALGCSGGDEATSRQVTTEIPRPTSTATPVPTSEATPVPSATLAPIVAPTPTAEPAPLLDAAKTLDCLKEFENLMFDYRNDEEINTTLGSEEVKEISADMAASSEACQQAGWDPVFATKPAEPCTKGDIIGSYGEKLRALARFAYTQDGKRIHANPTVVRIVRDETIGGPNIGFIIHFEEMYFSNDSGYWYNNSRDTYFYIRTSSRDVLYEFQNFEFADTPEFREALGLETS